MASPCLFAACEITLKVVEAGKSPPPCTAGCLPAHVVRSPLYVLLPVCMQVYPHGYVLQIQLSNYDFLWLILAYRNLYIVLNFLSTCNLEIILIT